MILQDGISFVDDVDTLQQLYGFGSPEEFLALDSMSGYAKQPQLDMALMSMNYQNPHMLALYQPQPYEVNGHNQQELVALPNSLNVGFEDNRPYANSETYDFGQQVPVTAAPVTHTIPSANVAPTVGRVQRENKKRKISMDSTHEEVPMSKRLAVAVQDPNGDYHSFSAGPSPCSVVPTPVSVPSQSVVHQLSGSPRTAGHHYSTSNASAISIPAPSPYTPTVSPAFTTANTETSPRAPSTPLPRPASASAADASNPRLVRTSTIPHQSPQPIGPAVGLPGHTHAFNPYTLYSPDSKARLHLDGNLDDVAKDWSEDELEARRKIVVFNREQKGNDIFATFKVVPQQEWKNHPSTVNCIWWKEKKEAFVTSVDTILLLESLVGARFTVEEKNRIRRNLEGFKPLTVSKAKSDSEDFFKVIMGFPNPKPRNIEKDVKVFPWRILQIALQKIISKYSASYASTASSISNGQAKLYRPVESAEYHYSVSPGPEYNGNMPQNVGYTGFETGSMPTRMSAPVTPVPSMPVSTMAPRHDMQNAYVYAPAHMPQGRPQYPPHAMTTTAGPGQYWGYQGYAGDIHVPMQLHGHPAYTRDMIENIDFGRR